MQPGLHSDPAMSCRPSVVDFPRPMPSDSAAAAATTGPTRMQAPALGLQPVAALLPRSQVQRVRRRHAVPAEVIA
eukprot:SAG31_NODE_3886_length_3784_cov_1.800543_3_plen_75_part_00